MKNKYLTPAKYYRGLQDIFLYRLKNKYPLKKQTNKRIYIFGVPMHGNLGDQAIIYAQLEFLKNVAPEYEIKLIHEDMEKAASEALLHIIGKDDIVAVPGGGNMGDVWWKYEEEREFVVETFKDLSNKIISFPQSYNFTDTDEGIRLKNRANAIYSYPKNLYVFARESLSYKNIEHNFNLKNKIGFVPDIVLSLDKRNPNIERTNALVILRSDKEIMKNSLKDELIFNFREKFSNVINSDTVSSYIPNIISQRTRNKLLSKKWNEFSGAKLVITDRLHGMIFAYITGTPAIVFDNQNHKVKNSYKDWLNDVDFIHFADDYQLEELEEIITNYMNTEKFMGSVSQNINEAAYSDLIKLFQDNL